MKKVIGIIILIIVTSCYFIAKNYNIRQQENIQTESSSKPIQPTYETIEPTGNFFIEKKNTFTYNNKTIQYLLIFPAEYTETTNQWPLIFFLHGRAERGQELNLVKSYGPPWFAEKQPKFPFVVLAPQCPEGEEWTNSPDALFALLDDILKKYRIDQKRVYLTGTSMGGNGTWYLASKQPKYFAAIAPLAAKPTIPTVWEESFISMPIWAFHGQNDPICPLKDDQEMINALRMQGGTPRFTIIPNEDHIIGGVYKDPELYKWFLSNIRHD